MQSFSGNLRKKLYLFNWYSADIHLHHAHHPLTFWNREKPEYMYTGYYGIGFQGETTFGTISNGSMYVMYTNTCTHTPMMYIQRLLCKKFFFHPKKKQRSGGIQPAGKNPLQWGHVLRGKWGCCKSYRYTYFHIYFTVNYTYSFFILEKREQEIPDRIMTRNVLPARGKVIENDYRPYKTTCQYI